jgi:hypothetical protein
MELSKRWHSIHGILRFMAIKLDKVVFTQARKHYMLSLSPAVEI